MSRLDRIHAALPDRVATWWENDVVKILSTLVGVYLLYIFMGHLLGYGISGQLNSLRRLTFLIVVYGIAALVVNLHWGYSGLFNIGVAGFMAVGVYTTTILSRPIAGQNPTGTLPGLGFPLPVAIIGGILAAAVVGYLAALPSLRLRDDYFAIVTLAFAEIIRMTFKSSELLEFTIFGTTLGTGGGRGIRTYPNPINTFFEGPGAPIVDAVSSAGIEGSLVQGWALVVAIAILLAVVYYLLVRIGESPFGRVLKGIRDDEEATESLAKHTSSFKIQAFVIGTGILGLLGVVWQGTQGYIDPSLFSPQLTFFVWIALIIGGIGSNTGTVIGSILFVGIVYLGPNYVRLLVKNAVELSGTVGTFPQAIHALTVGNVDPFLLYLFDQTNALRVVLTGVLLVWVLKTRPSGLFGDRQEIASAIDLQSAVADRRRDGGDADE